VAGGVNLYGFVHNDPLIYADPLGLQGYIGYGPPPASPDPIASAMIQGNLQGLAPGPPMPLAGEAARIQGELAHLEYGLAGLVYDFTPLGNLWGSATGTDFNGNWLTRDERDAAMQLAGIDVLTFLAPEARASKVPCAKPGKNVGHHSIPRAIQKELPPPVRIHPDVRGRRGNPNIRQVPEPWHKDVHSSPGGNYTPVETTIVGSINSSGSEAGMTQ
jgi:hypothetical protein